MIVPACPKKYWQSSAHSAVWLAIGTVPTCLTFSGSRTSKNCTQPVGASAATHSGTPTE